MVICVWKEVEICGKKLSELIELAKHIPEKYLSEAIEALKEIKGKANDDRQTPNCPHCNSNDIVKNGIKGGKQCYLCRTCKKTYGDSTDSATYYSHSSETVWKQVIRGTRRVSFCLNKLDKNFLSFYRNTVSFPLRQSLLG